MERGPAPYILKNTWTLRHDNYGQLKSEIGGGDIPYEELCPIVDELLPTTNEDVRDFVQFDIAMKRAQEAFLDTLMKIAGAALVLMAILFPPSIMLSGPVIAAGIGLSIAGIAVGARDYRRGSQIALSIGSGLHSRAEEDAAESQKFWGMFSIITSIIAGFLQLRELSALGQESRALNALEDVRPGSAESLLEGKGKGAAEFEVAPDVDTTAKPGDFTPEQLQSANEKLVQKLQNPKNIRKVSDPELQGKYDVEVELDDGQVYRRKTVGTWCLFRNPRECGITFGPRINLLADAQKAALEQPATVETVGRTGRLQERICR